MLTAMLTKDLTHAARLLRTSPVFTATAILILALGIGASTAIFSVANAVLLRPLPYKDPAHLVFVCSDMRKRGVQDFPFSNADFFDTRTGTQAAFADLGAVFTLRNILPAEDGTPEQIRFAVVTPNFFRLLGAKLSLGRDFDDSDAQPQTTQPPPPNIAILSYGYWQRRYGRDPAILGRSLNNTGNGRSRIVGVLAPGFELLFPPNANVEQFPDVWIANRIGYDAANRNNVSLNLIGRLKPGVSLQTAQTQADVVANDLRRTSVIHATSGWSIRVEKMNRYLVAGVRPTILALLGAVTFLLLIACANVANLLLVRASLRERELSIRTALGASAWRLARQIFTEALLLSILGAAAGLALAWLGLHQLLRIAPANIPRLQSVSLDASVLAFTAFAGLASAVIFGLAPALRAARPDVMQVLRGSGRSEGLAGGGLLRNSVVVLEVSLSFMLLIGSGLMVRSFIALEHIDPGYDSRGLLTFQLLGPQGNTPEQRAAHIREIERRLSTIPGVQSVTAASPFPLTGGVSPIRWGMQEALADPAKFQAADSIFVLPGYFEAMHTPLLEGRLFTEADNAPDRKGIIIDQFLAAKAFPHQSAAGKRILIRVRSPEPEWVEILGVVAHQRATSLAEPGREQIFVPDGLLGHGIVSRWAVRTQGDPARYTGAIRAQLAAFDPHSVMNEIMPMSAIVTKAQSQTRFSLLLLGIFAAIAALLAAVGLYGVLSTVVRQRTAEIGVRVAMGAAPTNIFQLVVGHGLRLSIAGIGLGLLAAIALTRLMASMLVGVKATDPLTFLVITILFLAITAASSWLPGRRAARLDPAAALRGE